MDCGSYIDLYSLDLEFQVPRTQGSSKQSSPAATRSTIFWPLEYAQCVVLFAMSPDCHISGAGRIARKRSSSSIRSGIMQELGTKQLAF